MYKNEEEIKKIKVLIKDHLPLIIFAKNMFKEPWWSTSLNVFWRLASKIVVTVVTGTLIGKWLDAKYHSEPWFFLTGFGLGLFLAMLILVKFANKEYSKLDGNKEFKKHEDKSDTKS